MSVVFLSYPEPYWVLFLVHSMMLLKASESRLFLGSEEMTLALSVHALMFIHVYASIKDKFCFVLFLLPENRRP